ncbi:MAG: transcriptional repressor LexA [Betaproteobacteria bacterium]|nr:transcriptional repressor LexA [Betaproteobacteria bacterium]
MEELTPRQNRILQFIRKSLESTGLPPTRAEIAHAMEFRSPNAAEEHLRMLERKGAIEILKGSARGIRLKDGGGLPLIGRVAAGSPILAEAHVQGHYQVDPALFKPSADYLLRVRGMSMRDAGILDGDLLAVHRTSEARSGQVVVARFNDEVTVKRLRRKGAMVELLPENPEFEPIVIDTRREELTIEGLGVGVIRSGRAL